jgi:hypothetical protein
MLFHVAMEGCLGERNGFVCFNFASLSESQLLYLQVMQIAFGNAEVSHTPVLDVLFFLTFMRRI